MKRKDAIRIIALGCKITKIDIKFSKKTDALTLTVRLGKQRELLRQLLMEHHVSDELLREYIEPDVELEDDVREVWV